jgi:hypothetical protein
MEQSGAKQKKYLLRSVVLGASFMLLAGCAVVEPEPEYGEEPYGYGPPVYYSAYPYYAAPPPVVSFGFGGGGYHGYYGRGRW